MPEVVELPGHRGGGAAIPLLADGHAAPNKGDILGDGAGGDFSGGDLDDAIEGVEAEEAFVIYLAGTRNLAGTRTDFS